MSGYNQESFFKPNLDLDLSIDDYSCLSLPASRDSVRTSPSISTNYSSFTSKSSTKVSSRVNTPPGIQKVRNICCIGAGYVGGPTSAVLALQNPDIRVTVVDKDAHRIRRWTSRHLPIYEPGLDDVVRVVRDGTNAVNEVPISGLVDTTINLPARLPNLFFSTDVYKCVSEADMIFLSVNTNTKPSGIGAGAATNMAALEEATQEIAAAAQPGTIIVEKSTVPCRTAQIIHDTLKVHRPDDTFEILSNPEFLAEGTAIKDLLDPDRIIIGSAQTPSGVAAAEALKAVYSAWVPIERIITINLWSAELSKLVANSMLAQRISSINTISAICERTGADIDEVATSIGLDARLGPKFLKAGLGFGGSCFKKDLLSLVYLAQSLDLPEVAEYWIQVLKINKYQNNRFVKHVVKSLNDTLIGKKIAILGYAFKNGTSDTRESPAAEVVRSLLAENPAEIAIFDPKCSPEDMKNELEKSCKDTYLSIMKPEGPVMVYRNAYDACNDATAVLILTDWTQFRYPELKVPDSVFKNDTGHEADSKTSNNSSALSSLSSATNRHLPNLTSRISETEILNLHNRLEGKRHLISNGDARGLNDIDIFGRFVEQPVCEEGCRDCLRGDEETTTCENVAWKAIAGIIKKPKWIFDGRGIIDVAEMEKLGFRVEVIGKVGLRSRLHGFGV